MPLTQPAPLPCCTVRTNSLEQSRVASQTEYWLQYWYNDVSSLEDGEEEECWATPPPPPIIEGDIYPDLAEVSSPVLSPPKLGNIASQARITAKVANAVNENRETNGVVNSESNGVVSSSEFGIVQAMKTTIMPIMATCTSEPIPINEEPECETDCMHGLDIMIRSSLESTYGHTEAERQKQEAERQKQLQPVVEDLTDQPVQKQSIGYGHSSHKHNHRVRQSSRDSRLSSDAEDADDEDNYSEESYSGVNPLSSPSKYILFLITLFTMLPLT